MVSRPEDYPWSNYGRLIRGDPDPLVDPRFLLGILARYRLQRRDIVVLWRI